MFSAGGGFRGQVSQGEIEVYIHRVPKSGRLHQAHIDNLVNSQRIFKILSLTHSADNFAIKLLLKVPPHLKHVATLPCETRKL